MHDDNPEQEFKSRETLREHYAEPHPVAVAVTKTQLDQHHRRFIERSPFLCIASADRDGYPTVSPRGGPPGFVHILDDTTLVLPDRPGNNKIETFENLMDNPKIALIFFVPGVRETVRVRGSARLVRDAATLERWSADGKQPRAAMVIRVERAYMHCGKALIRARLWDSDSQLEAHELPSFGQIVKDQAGMPMSSEELQQAIEHSYQEQLV